MIVRRDNVSVRHGTRVPATPRVSVIIPAYKSPWIDEALESVRAQTYRSFEILVVDDGSPRPVEPARSDDLTMIRQENNGPGGARNRGVEWARGEFVAFLDSDDHWLPTKLEHQIRYLDEHPECVLTCTDARQFGDSGVHERTVRDRYGCSPGPIPFEHIFYENCIVCSSAAVRRETYLATPGMPTGRRIGEDYTLWLRIARLGSIDFLDEVHVERRLHEQSLMRESECNGSSFEAQMKIYEDFLAENPSIRDRPFVKRALARLAIEGGCHYLERGRWSEARSAFAQSLRHRPVEPQAWGYWARAVLHIGPRT